MTKAELILLEIAWCETHPGESGKGKMFEEGFIEGLKQAARLVKSRPKPKEILRRTKTKVVLEPA